MSRSGTLASLCPLLIINKQNTKNITKVRTYCIDIKVAQIGPSKMVDWAIILFLLPSLVLVSSHGNMFSPPTWWDRYVNILVLNFNLKINQNSADIVHFSMQVVPLLPHNSRVRRVNQTNVWTPCANW